MGEFQQKCTEFRLLLGLRPRPRYGGGSYRPTRPLRYQGWGVGGKERKGEGEMEAAVALKPQGPEGP